MPLYHPVRGPLFISETILTALHTSYRNHPYPDHWDTVFLPVCSFSRPECRSCRVDQFRRARSFYRYIFVTIIESAGVNRNGKEDSKQPRIHGHYCCETCRGIVVSRLADLDIHKCLGENSRRQHEFTTTAPGSILLESRSIHRRPRPS